VQRLSRNIATVPDYAVACLRPSALSFIKSHLLRITRITLKTAAESETTPPLTTQAIRKRDASFHTPLQLCTNARC